MRTAVRTRPQAGAAVWFGAVGAAAVAWAITIVVARSMGNGAGTMGLGLAPFLALWVAMMVAMMSPSVAPVAVLWTRTMASDPLAVRAGRTASFLGGYMLAWATYGVVVFVTLAALGRLAGSTPRLAIWVGAGIYAAVGTFQLTPVKQACLRRCRTPIGFVLRFSEIRGRSRDLRAGVYHGAVCVACCWALMGAIVALGAMNLAAMVGLAILILLEKVWRGGPWVARAAGVAFLALAVLTPFHPWLAPGLHTSAGTAGMTPMSSP